MARCFTLPFRAAGIKSVGVFAKWFSWLTLWSREVQAYQCRLLFYILQGIAIKATKCISDVFGMGLGGAANSTLSRKLQKGLGRFSSCRVWQGSCLMVSLVSFYIHQLKLFSSDPASAEQTGFSGSGDFSGLWCRAALSFWAFSQKWELFQSKSCHLRPCEHKARYSSPWAAAGIIKRKPTNN